MEVKYEIVDIKVLRPLEKVFPTHLRNLSNMIGRDGVIKCPIIADKETGIVLDGSHRYIYLLGNGYKEAPVRFVNYKDENIRVGTHLVHRYLCEQANISKREVVSRGISGNLFPPRTTRHFFPFRKLYAIDVPLSDLTKGKKVDIKKFIEKVSVKYEIQHNENFIREIETEIDEIIVYLDEVRQTKKYLEEQIERMKE